MFCADYISSFIVHGGINIGMVKIDQNVPNSELNNFPIKKKNGSFTFLEKSILRKKLFISKEYFDRKILNSASTSFKIARIDLGLTLLMGRWPVHLVQWRCILLILYAPA